MNDELRQAREAFVAVTAHVCRITALTSCWNAEVEIGEDLDHGGDPAYFAKKAWRCSLVIHASRLRSGRLIESLVHEAFHSVSAGLNAWDFRRWPGWEEGVVERLTMLYGPEIAKSVGIDASFDRNAFARVTEALEELRMSARRESQSFYVDMVRTPLMHRESTMVQWLQEANVGSTARELLAAHASELQLLPRG